MASTYSPYLRLELIGTGEQTGTWGNTTNINLGTLVDQAVAGTATIDVTLGDVTLTALNGASDQSRQAILKITGTPVAARNIVAPESSKWYLISNECGQTVTLKGASTTGYPIATGSTLLMFWTGTDFAPGSSTALGYTPVNKAGDTMTGNLILNAAPSTTLGAATKGYVDDAVSGAVGGNFVLKSGDTMTGALTLPGAPTTSLQAATKGYVDSSISGAGYATQSWVTSQNYATNSTSSLSNYYTKTDSDNRYVSTSTQNLQYYPLSTTVANTYATITGVNSALSNYVTSSFLTTNYSTTTTANAAYLSKTSANTNVQNLYFNGTESTALVALGAAGLRIGSYYTSITGNTNQIAFGMGTSGTTVFAMYNSGNATAPGTWQSLSDARLKENVTPVSGALTTIGKLNPIKFSMKKDKLSQANRYGLLAQELEQVVPEAVDTTEADFDGVENVKAVAYTELVPILIKAIQELKAEVDALKAAK